MPAKPNSISQTAPLDGFALVIALSLMAFVLLLILSLTTLVSVETRVSKQHRQRTAAELNALLGLNIALGELQSAAGPDQRVSATGALWKNPENGTEHLIGIWNSDINDRTNYGEFVKWLVSRRDASESSDIDLVRTPMPVNITGDTYNSSDPNYVLLVGNGSTNHDPNRPNDIQGVVAETIPINPADGMNGHIAWWIGDEGVKAAINTIDPYANELIDQSTSPWKGLDAQWAHLSQLSAQGTNLAAVDTYTNISFTDRQQAEDLSKAQNLTDLSHLNFTPQGGTVDEAIKRNFHSMTTTSFGLQTNVREGGLKRDLSLLFELPEGDYYSEILPTLPTDLVYEGAVGPQADLPLLFSEPIPGKNQSIYGPTLDMLRDYYRLYKGVRSQGFTPTLKQDWAHTFFPGKAWLQNNRSYAEEGEAWRESLATLAWRNEKAIKAPELNRTVTHSDSGDTISVIRPTQGTYLPYLSRFSLFASTVTQAQGTGYSLDVILQPFVALHNPYNVRIESPPMRLLMVSKQLEVSVRREDPANGWNAANRFQTGGTGLVSPEEGVYKWANGTGRFIVRSTSFYIPLAGSESLSFAKSDEQEIAMHLPATIYEPGEVKLFAAAGSLDGRNSTRRLDLEPFGGNFTWQNGIYLNLDKINNNLPTNTSVSNANAGLVDHDKDANGGGSNDGGSARLPLFRDISSNTELQVNLVIKDRFPFVLEVESQTPGIYDSVASYHHFPDDPDTNSDGSGVSGNLDDTSDYLDYLAPVTDFENNPTPNMVFDLFVRPLDYDEWWFGEGPSNFSQKNKTFPNFLISNPLATSFNRYANANREHYGLGNMFHVLGQKFTPSEGQSAQFRLYDGDKGTWGSGIGADGNPRTVLMEIPVAPMQSLGQFQHASLTPLPNQPALSIGHSTRSPYLSATDATAEVFTEDINGETREFVNYDQNYLANQALWDGYFMSSIAPRPSHISYSANSVTTTTDPFNQDIPTVVDDFLSGATSLSNSRMHLISNTETPDSVRADLLNFERSAQHLAVAGSFNVNSTSVDAWTAFLAVHREAAIIYNDAGKLNLNSASKHSSFPRQTLPGGPEVDSSATTSSDASWAGFLQIDDNELRSLAQAIVTEIKARAAHRNSATEPRPALSLSDFINRLLTPNTDFSNSGTLQAAIDRTSLNDSILTANTEFDASVYNALYPSDKIPNEYPDPNFKLNSAHISPVALNQANILQAVGPSLSARSDTFKLRAYGSGEDSFGSKHEAWCEAIYQRTTKWVDAADTSKGRRFRMISFRWLSPDEV
jgi:Tfp pilus assembly protein PilX